MFRLVLIGGECYGVSIGLSLLEGSGTATFLLDFAGSSLALGREGGGGGVEVFACGRGVFCLRLDTELRSSASGSSS